MQKLTGTIHYKLFAEGTKSESQRPYIFLDNGGQILLYKKEDNPFETNGFTAYDGKEVTVEGEFTEGVFEVETILEIQPDAEEEASEGEI